MIKKSTIVGTLSLFILFLSSCQSDALLNENQIVSTNGWSEKTPLSFQVHAMDTAQAYTCLISVRHTKEFAWMNLFLFIRTTFPDKSISIDTIECPLADYQGKWLGKNAGKYIDHSFLLKNGIRFPDTGSYRFDIYQGMRTTNLSNIENIGFKIIPSR